MQSSGRMQKAASPRQRKSADADKKHTQGRTPPSVSLRPCPAERSSARTRQLSYNLRVDSPIQCTNLRKTYARTVEAVRGISLQIEAGQCFGLLGPNGAGKTTTIEILEGLLAPTSGEARILGHTWDDNPRQLREWIGVSLQETRLSEKLNVRETIELFASFYSEPRPADDILEELQLTEKSDAWV